MLRRVFLILVLLVQVSCLEPSSSKKSQDDHLWQKARWVQKVANSLSASQLYLDPSEREELLSKTENEILQELMARPEFVHGVADFNLYYLGFKSGSYRNIDNGQDRYTEKLFAKPQALNSALALMSGRDYKQSLLAVSQPGSMPMIQKPYQMPKGRNPREYRKQKISEAKTALDQIIAEMGIGPEFNRDATCQALFNNETITGVFFELGSSEEFSFKIFWAFLRHVQDICYFEQDLSESAVRPRIKSIHTMFDSILDLFNGSDGKSYPMPDLASVKNLDLKDLGLPDYQSRFTIDGFWNVLENSSTNFNRRRAAYILKTYFCDDLTPLNVALPEVHSGDAHGSEPACQACHYKLDPMAGFFRHHGQRGRYFSAEETGGILIFDDGTIVVGDKFEEYLNTWRDGGKKTGKWNIGYIRSARDSSVNSYGDSMEDLFEIIQTAPEVDRCLVKRLAEYLIGPEQAVDGGWLNHLTDQFTSAPDSTAGFKKVVASVVKSSAFRASNPDPRHCYDKDPVSGDSSIPCQVSFLTKTYCAGCHSDVDGPGSLDFSKWVTNAHGEETFPHRGGDGKDLTKAQSYARILDRLSTSDPDLIMPKNTNMSAVDRASLYRWLDQQRNAH